MLGVAVLIVVIQLVMNWLELLLLWHHVVVAGSILMEGLESLWLRLRCQRLGLGLRLRLWDKGLRLGLRYLREWRGSSVGPLYLF